MYLLCDWTTDTHKQGTYKDLQEVSYFLLLRLFLFSEPPPPTFSAFLLPFLLPTQQTTDLSLTSAFPFSLPLTVPPR